jgi:hypothetical protein
VIEIKGISRKEGPSSLMGSFGCLGEAHRRIFRPYSARSPPEPLVLANSSQEKGVFKNFGPLKNKGYP